MTIDTLLKKIKTYNPDADFELIKKAYDFAKKAHQGQKRESGEDYIQHLLRTACCLAEMKLSANTIAAGLLHDTVEDTEITNKDIQKEFGKEIAFLVEGISKLGKIKYHGVQRHVENLRKIFLAMAKDIRVVLIKFCDRLHNLETLNYLPPEKQKRIAMETLEIYAPLCYRLGMGGLKGRLEDVSFPYVYPKEYQELLNQVKEQYEEREKYLKKVNSVVEKKLRKAGVRVIEIHSRSKRYYSLYKKLQRYDNDLSKIYDLVALRIIVKDVKDCYRTLGIIHKLWKPLPGRIKDYIAMPKLNTYRSLHTTVFCLGGKIIEFQIRTPKMHKEAEFGIAAHWYYSEQRGLASRIKKLITKAPEKKLQWVKQLQEWQEEAKDFSPDEYLKSLKIDFFKNRIFVFTPRGDVIDLPDGATAVDFAYAVHTEVGNQCAGAKINEKMVSLSQPLKNEDVVEIIIDKKRIPSQDWLKFVKTNMARSRIKNWFKRESQSSRLIKGKQILGKAIQDIKIKEKKVIKSLKISLKPKKKPKVFIAGKTGYLINLAKCCDPKPGDKIQAYITKDQGASVHKIDCARLKQAQKKWPQKIIQASWKKQ
ncbi:bifunctional (p)ppGpp synthetase/guanosine-3',5'-bis(diphosphate) 3'-pyrophosphohydrolase [Candidatus Parcubacteria bacterium]|nr:bifunctional (p)ppGpp synthetase/guanosine-3',5'-bis(diphosphate) 3'-pyrophosphohydrolase [Candidatus Parcubacteria bacterium]